MRLDDRRRGFPPDAAVEVTNGVKWLSLASSSV